MARGLIDHATARRWSVAVWGPSDDDFMMADMALGFWEQNGAEVTRDSLIEYAVKGEYTWALRDFLDSRGWMDDDWAERLVSLEGVSP